MAINIDKLKEEVIAIAKGKGPKHTRTQPYNYARAKLDEILEFIKDKKQLSAILKEIDKALKPDSSITFILKGDPVEKHRLIHDAYGESLEPTYYWILDFLRDTLNMDVSKSAEYFSSSEASGYFGEMGARRTALEKQAIELMKTINAVVKSVINLLYDLKLFDIRLKNYEDLKSKDPEVKKNAVWGLKSIWLTEVDAAQKGLGSINSLVQNLQFVTLRDAFMIVPVEEWYVPNADTKKIGEIKSKAANYVKGMDLTDIVKRVLAPRIQEFVEWLYLSEKELRSRREIEKAYLKAQVDSLKIYTRWVRPYLIATQKLIPAEFEEIRRQKEVGLDPSIAPTAFHVIWMYLELLAKTKAKITTRKPIVGEVGELELEDESNRPYAVVEVRMAFRGSPVTAIGARGERGYGFTGKATVFFNGYVMQKKHLDLLEQWKDDEILDFIDKMTKETLDALADDLKKYLEEKPIVEEKKKEPSIELPFAKWVKETFGTMKAFQNQIKQTYLNLAHVIPNKKDAWNIARLMLRAEYIAKNRAFTCFDIYKKAHGMLSWPT
ncbi:MAG: hypothetical protein QW625_02300 [Candidatus Nanoarchaeia archaeon]